MARKQRRNPVELVKEAEEKLQRAKERAIAATAEEHPILAPIFEVMEKVSANIATEQRKLNGPQSFANRRQAFQLRMKEIDAGERFAIAAEELYNSQRDYLREKIGNLVSQVVNGKEPTEADIEKVRRGMPQKDLSALEESFTTARDARKNYRRAEVDSEDLSEAEMEEAEAHG